MKMKDIFRPAYFWLYCKAQPCSKIKLSAHIYICVFLLHSHDSKQKNPCMSCNIWYMFYCFDLEKLLSCWFSLVLSICLCVSVCRHCAGCPLVAHPSVFSTLSTNWDWSTETSTYSDWSGHRWTWLSPQLTRTSDGRAAPPTDTPWDAASWWPERVKAADPTCCLISSKSIIPCKLALSLSRLWSPFSKSPAADWEAESNSEHKFKAPLKWRWLSQGQHAVKGM